MQLRTQVVILVAVGGLLIAGSILFHLFFDQLFNSMMNKKLLVVPGSQTLENFKSPPVPIFMQFWLFNVTNSEEVLQGSMPVLQQVGPYTYEENQVKYNLSFNHDEGTVTYLQNKTFYYRQDLSPGVSLDDRITTVNAVMMSLGSKLKNDSSAFHVVVQLWFDRFDVSPFVTKSVRELLFDGYDEPLLQEIGKISKDPKHILGKFGFYRNNNTNGGTYTVYTGEKGMDNYQHIAWWRGKEEIDFWKPDLYGGNTCNMINGTAGNQFPRPVERNGILPLYVAELCRSIYAEYQKDVQHGALTLYRHVLPKKLLADTPENECYCVDDFTCRASMINVAPCRDGAPVVMSTPHFYHGAKEDADRLGLEPVASEHETYLDIEPNTGVTFRAAKRIQANVPMKQYQNLPAFRSVPDVIVPVFWVNESAVVPVERTYALHRTLNLPHLLVTIGVAVLVALGVVLVVVAIVKVCLARRGDGSSSTTAGAKNNNKKKKSKRIANMSKELEREKDKSVMEKLNSRNYS